MALGTEDILSQQARACTNLKGYPDCNENERPKRSPDDNPVASNCDLNYLYFLVPGPGEQTEVYPAVPSTAGQGIFPVCPVWYGIDFNFARIPRCKLRGMRSYADQLKI